MSCAVHRTSVQRAANTLPTGTCELRMIVYQLAWYSWEYDSGGHNEFAKTSMQPGKQVASCSERCFLWCEVSRDE
jgi:hypothetical protein